MTLQELLDTRFGPDGVEVLRARLAKGEDCNTPDGPETRRRQPPGDGQEAAIREDRGTKLRSAIEVLRQLGSATPNLDGGRPAGVGKDARTAGHPAPEPDTAKPTA